MVSIQAKLGSKQGCVEFAWHGDQDGNIRLKPYFTCKFMFNMDPIHKMKLQQLRNLNFSLEDELVIPFWLELNLTLVFVCFMQLK
jgi:hypothetical protein